MTPLKIHDILKKFPDARSTGRVCLVENMEWIVPKDLREIERIIGCGRVSSSTSYKQYIIHAELVNGKTGFFAVYGDLED